MIDQQTGWTKHIFAGQTGYIIAPWLPNVNHELAAVRHSASVSPWTDQDIHAHAEAEEFYFVFQGELHLQVADSVFTLKPHEAFMVRPGIPHAVVGGNGLIEHFVLRMPAVEDRKTLRTIPTRLPPITVEPRRKLQFDWGARVPLSEKQYQNCWLFGVDQALFYAKHMCLAYLNFPTEEAVKENSHYQGRRLHLHQQSWELYVVLKGAKVLQIDNQSVEIKSGEILAVPPQTRHVLETIYTPFEGFTFRVPRLNDKIEF